jgi:hypothetical protein
LKSIPIEQYTKDNIFIKEWESINDATEFLKLKSASSISNALNGRSKMAGGLYGDIKKNHKSYCKLKNIIIFVL